MPSIHRDGADGPGRAQVLAGAAADAHGLVHDRAGEAVLIVLDHPDGAGGAVAGAVAAGCPVLRDAQRAVHLGRTHMVLRLLFLGDFQDGPRGAHLGAAGALRPAVAALVGHLGLHEMLQVRGGTKDAVRALRYAQLAGRAPAVEILDALGSRRRNGHVAVRNLLVQDRGETAIDLLLLRLERRRSYGQRRAGHECASAFVLNFGLI